VYGDILKQAGVIRAPGLNDMLEYARGLPVLPTPKGDNIVIITGAGGSGVLLSDAVTDNGLSLMEIPPDLDASFGSSSALRGRGQPGRHHRGRAAVDVRGDDPAGLEDRGSTRWSSVTGTPSSLPRWSSRSSPRAWFAEFKERGIEKPVVASLAGDVESRRPASTCTSAGSWRTRTRRRSRWPVLGAKYQWARAAGLLGGGS